MSRYIQHHASPLWTPDDHNPPPSSAHPRIQNSAALPLLGAAALRGATSRMGYGSYGASQRKIGLEEWHAHSGTPDEDIICNLPLLRQRSRDLFMGAPLAAAAILALRTNVVGNGLVAMPQIDGDVLRKSTDECSALNKFLSDEFDVFADTVECDYSRRSTFYQLQDLVFVNACISGDVLALLPMRPRRGSVYDTRIRLIEADRVASPVPIADVPTTDSGAPRIFGGVELDAYGEVVAYWIAKQHPLSLASLASISANGFQSRDEDDFERVPAFGDETGRPVALLVGEMERPEQRRAVPLMSKCLTELKNLQRYIESTTVQNVIKSYFTAFITSQMPSTEMFVGLVDDNTLADLTARDPYKVQLAPGVVNWMRPGDKIEFPVQAGPEDQFEPYVTSLCKFVGASMRIPFEVLLMTFNASYSASRASLLQFWGRVKVMRQGLIDQFVHPVYVAWLMEAIARGVIKAPGFFDDPRVFRAWTRCSWSGPGPGSIDPVKEVQAAEKRLKNGLTTLERECLELNGSDWRQNTLQQALERDLADELDLPYVRAAQVSPFGGGGAFGSDGGDGNPDDGQDENP